MRTLIKNGIIVNYDGSFQSDILIKDGKIERIFDFIEEDEVDVERVIDARGDYILPGFIDAHTHPGLPEDLGFHKTTNDFFTETKAALMGGTTTIFDFAEQKKGQRLIDALRERESRYDGVMEGKHGFPCGYN